MDHAVKATGPRSLTRLLDRQRFENEELEALYRRYALKLQRASVSTALALVLLLAVSLGALGAAYSRAPTLQNVWYAVGAAWCGLLLLIVHVRPSRDSRLAWACRGALVAAALLAGAGLAGGAAKGRAAAQGAWHVVFAVFVAYGMLPVRGWVAALVGLLLPLAHTATVVFFLMPTDFPNLAWQQVIFILFFFFFTTLKLGLGKNGNIEEKNYFSY